MAKFIRRKKQHLNEDDANQQTQQPSAQSATNNAPLQTAPEQTQQPVQQQTDTTALTLQTDAQPKQQQQTQQQTLQLVQPSQEQQQVNTFLTGLRDNILKGNIYWALSINLADEIQKAIPSFKADNQAAKPGIDAWEAFKKEPQELTFNTFIDQLSKFGAPQQEAPAPAEQAQQAQQLQDSIVLDFGARLEEKLQNKLKMDFYAKQIAKGLNDN